MVKVAVVKSGGKQYLVKNGDEITVDSLSANEKDKIDLETLAIFDSEKEIKLGSPNLKEKIKAQVLAHMKGEKIRIGRFKAKSRFRKVRGFRPSLSKIKILDF